MIQVRRFLMAAVVLLLTTAVRAQVAQPDSVVHNIFEALRTKDQQAFVAQYPNAEQFSRFIRDLMEKAFKSEAMKQLMAQDEKAKALNIDSLVEAQIAVATSRETLAEMHQQFGEIFQRIIAKGEKKGVNWSEAKLTGFTIDSTQEPIAATRFQPVDMKTIKGVIEFTSGGRPYQLAFEKMLYLPTENRWFGADFPQLARKGESLLPDRVIVKDTVGSAVLENPPTLLPPPKKKQAPAKASPAARKPKAKV